VYLKDQKTKEVVSETCGKYGLQFKETETGIWVKNSAGENFLMRFSKNSKRIRKLLHESHRKGFNTISTFDPDNFTRQQISESFHIQEVYDGQGGKETDVARILNYIYWHGKNREKMENFRRKAVSAILA